LNCNQQIGVACTLFAYVDVELFCSFKNSMLPIPTSIVGDWVSPTHGLAIRMDHGKLSYTTPQKATQDLMIVTQ